MKRLSVAAVIILGCLLVFASCATPPAPETKAVQKDSIWLTSYDEAVAASKVSGKPILATFTAGIDDPWGAPWDWKMNQETFDTPMFKRWAKENVIPLMLVYPYRQPQRESISEANLELARKYKILDDYPIMVFMKPDGTEIGRLGYERDGAANFIALSEKILASAK